MPFCAGRTAPWRCLISCGASLSASSWSPTRSFFFRPASIIRPRLALTATHKHLQCRHVQYLLFVAGSSSEALAHELALRFVTRALDPGLAPLTRQAAIAYVASYAARASFLPAATVHECLTLCAGWVHKCVRRGSASPRRGAGHSPWPPVPAPAATCATQPSRPAWRRRCICHSTPCASASFTSSASAPSKFCSSRFAGGRRGSPHSSGVGG